jgi:hypothetical protein
MKAILKFFLSLFLASVLIALGLVCLLLFAISPVLAVPIVALVVFGISVKLIYGWL